MDTEILLIWQKQFQISTHIWYKYGLKSYKNCRKYISITTAYSFKNGRWCVNYGCKSYTYGHKQVEIIAENDLYRPNIQLIMIIIDLKVGLKSFGMRSLSFS